VNIEVLVDADSVARRAATIIAEHARDCVAARHRFILAVSGGRTPWIMLREFAGHDAPWADMVVVQVDERIAPANGPDRNITFLRDSLKDSPLRNEQIHAMPVEAPNLEAAAAEYSTLLQPLAGSLPVLDLVHLGLGADGHTASLVPGDPALDVNHDDVALTGVYRGRRRMTLTFPVLNRARLILWVVTGGDKADALARLRNGDESIPAGRVQRDRAILIADESASGYLNTR
jgi:6-phosphogluconolactonase